MLPTRLQQVYYDPLTHKTLGQQKNGRFEIVDSNPETAGLEIGSDGNPVNYFFLLPGLYPDHFIDIDVPAGKHYIVTLTDSIVPDWIPDVNSTFTFTNIGEGTLEFWGWDYTQATNIKSPLDTHLGPGGQTVLRYRGDRNWTLSAGVQASNALTYDVTVASFLIDGVLTNKYVLDDGNGSVTAPTINLVVNQEVIFNVNIPGHPLWIWTANATGPNPDTGFISGGYTKNPGVETGEIRFRPWKTGTFWYHCEYHPNMGGQIVVT